MGRTVDRVAWERLLDEPVAALSPVRPVGGALVWCTAVLTPMRFLIVDRSRPHRPPRNPRHCRESIAVEFPRSNLTDIDITNGRRPLAELRYFDGTEKRIRFRVRRGSLGLFEQMEQDLVKG